MGKAKSVAELKQQMEQLAAEIAEIQSANVSLAKTASANVLEAIAGAGVEITLETLGKTLKQFGYVIRYSGKVLPTIITTLKKEMEESKGGILDYSGKGAMAKRAKELQVPQQDLRTTIEATFISSSNGQGRPTKWKGLKE